jgi:hypothetical protein
MSEEKASVLTSLKLRYYSSLQPANSSTFSTTHSLVEKKGTSKLLLYFYFGATGIEATRRSTLDYYYCLLRYNKTVRSRVGVRT